MKLRLQKRVQIRSVLLPGFGILCFFVVLFALCILLETIFKNGWDSISYSFISSFPSRFPAKAGVLSAILGTLWMISLTAMIVIPVGVGTALFLVEYMKDTRLRRVIEANIRTLSGVPSVVFGLLGLAIFVRFFSFDRSLLSGSLTMSLVVLPLLVISSIEALKAVPESLRMAAYGVGATRSQMIFGHLLPAALPGITTGILLCLSRALGESAPLIMIGALSFVAFVPSSIRDSFTVLAIQIFNWAGRPQPEFQHIAAAGIIILISMTLVLNVIAIWIRSRLMK